MKQNLRIYQLIACCALLLSVAITPSWAQKWKNAPKVLKDKATLSHGLTTKLPLQPHLKQAPLNPAVQAAVNRTVTSQLLLRPAQLESFNTWLGSLKNKKIAATSQTLLALTNIHQAIENYEQITPQERSKINLLMITLNQLRSKLGALDNGDFYKLVYPQTLAANELPQHGLFRVRLSRTGLQKYTGRVQKALRTPFKGFFLVTDYSNENKIAGLSFSQGFQPGKTQQELDKFMQIITPPDYTVRMGLHELGLNNQRQKFRHGDVHMHLEKSDFRTNPVPVEVSIRFWLSVKPYAGVIDPKTRKIIAPFSDKMIARNYLVLFDKYLTPQARRSLENIAY